MFPHNCIPVKNNSMNFKLLRYCFLRIVFLFSIIQQTLRSWASSSSRPRRWRSSTRTPSSSPGRLIRWAEWRLFQIQSIKNIYRFIFIPIRWPKSQQNEIQSSVSQFLFHVSISFLNGGSRLYFGKKNLFRRNLMPKECYFSSQQ